MKSSLVQLMFGGNRISVQDIYTYLNSRQFNLSSDKIVKEPQSHPEVVWNILVYLCMPLKDEKYSQIEPSLVYMLDNEGHKMALKKMNQYITVSTVLKKLGYTPEYPFRQIFKPDKQTLIDKLSTLIGANKFHQMIQKKFELSTLQQKSLRQNIKEEREREEQLLIKIQQKKLQLESQRELREEKKQSIEAFNVQRNYKKKQKIDLLNSQQQLTSELSKKKKQLSNAEYQNDNLSIRIRELERDVIQNAPKLKKQRIQLMEEYEKQKNRIQRYLQDQQNKMQIVNRFIQETQKIASVSQSKNVERIRQQKIQRLQRIEKIRKQKEDLKKVKQHLSKENSELRATLQGLQRQKQQFSRDYSQKQNNDKQLTAKQSKLKDQIHILGQRFEVIQQKMRNSRDVENKLNGKVKFRLSRLQKRVINLRQRQKSMEEEMMKIIDDAFKGFERYSQSIVL